MEWVQNRAHISGAEVSACTNTVLVYKNVFPKQQSASRPQNISWPAIMSHDQ